MCVCWRTRCAFPAFINLSQSLGGTLVMWQEQVMAEE